MDKIVKKLVALGIPGIVLLMAISTSGLAGGAAIVAALAAIGGPFGMMGGLAGLGSLTLISDAIGQYGIERLFKEVIKGLQQKGISTAEIQKAVESYPISKELKSKLKNYLTQI